MKKFYISLITICTAVSAYSQQLVKDINTIIAAGANKGSSISNMVRAGNKVYFTASDKTSGEEPWVTDGTAAGTYMLRDINPGKATSNPALYTLSNGTVYFRADDGSHGNELWKTDGTPQGTVMVRNHHLHHNSFGSPYALEPSKLTDVNGVLYFAGEDDPSSLDAGIWRTDGTAAGTMQVLNLNTYFAFGQYNPEKLFALNGQLYFVEERPAATTTSLYRLGAGNNEILIYQDLSVISDVVVIGNVAYFMGQPNAGPTAVGTELWRTDGTNAGTYVVKDINPGNGPSNPEWLTNVNGTLFFSAWDGVNGGELWKSDGTAAGTVMVKDLYAGDNTTNEKPTQLVNVNGTLFFNGLNITTGRELWKSDGTEAGTVLVKDISAGGGSGNPFSLTDNNGQLLFTYINALWKSDGTSAGTVEVKNFSSCQQITPLPASPGQVVLYANEANNGELWKTDGTAAGTIMLKNIAPDNPDGVYGAIGGYPRVDNSFAFSNDKFFLSAESGTNSTNNKGLYQTQGTDASTIRLNTAGTLPAGSVNFGGYIYFSFTNAAIGNELWRTDGTIAGTTLVKDINPSGSSGSAPANFCVVNNTLYFRASDGVNGTELWKTDGTAAGTIMVKNIRPAANTSSNPTNLTNCNGTLFFTADNGTNGNELWKSDGTDAGTIMLKDIYPGSNGSINTGNNNELTVMGNQIFFAAFNPTLNRELWKSDGTEAGTVLVKDISVGTGGSSIKYLTAVNNILFFVADDHTTFGVDEELWATDGTNAGTYLVKDINPGRPPSKPSNLINFNGSLYFSAYTHQYGYELWKSDGTNAGTVMVKDIEPGKHSGMQSGDIVGTLGIEFKDIVLSNGKIYFPAATAAFGRELWQSDGTEAGTVMVSDLFAGPQSSDPEKLTVADGDIYMVADNGITNKELYVYKPIIGFSMPAGNAQNSININWQNDALVEGSNQLIATVYQAGAQPLNGAIQVKLTINADTIMHNGRTLAKKQVDIEPAVNAATGTAMVTLYFSQADFDEYNTKDNLGGDLPTSANDNAGKANLRIIQYHGVGTAPANYPGAEEIIDPADANITWNAAGNYWSVQFPVTGFSGFYLSSVAGGVLPVNWLYVKAQLQANNTALISWGTAQESNTKHYEVEHSTNGNSFIKTGTVNATGNSSTALHYSFTHLNVPAGINYYRIKQIDTDGKFSYSAVIVLRNNYAQTKTVIATNPVENILTVVEPEMVFIHSFQIFDSKGALVLAKQMQSRQRVISLPVTNLLSGHYVLKINYDTHSKSIQLIKK
jgi:ELWxxDGT repeat protein